MMILSIDSSGPVASAAVLSDDRVLIEYNADFGKKHSTTLLPMIREIMDRVGLTVKNVDAIAVTAGPGSFTGLRIGSATAKGLALAGEKPIIPVPTLGALAMNFCGSGDLICPIMDARRSQVYNALYRFDGTKLIPLTDQRAVYVDALIQEVNDLCSADEPTRVLTARPDKDVLVSELPAAKRVIFLGDGVPVYRKRIEEGLSVPAFFAPPHICRQRAASAGFLALQIYADGIYESADAHAPIYLRKSQAEQEKERSERAAAEKAEDSVRESADTGAGQGSHEEKGKIQIRVMDLNDLEDVCAIEKENFPEDPWSMEGFAAHALREDTVYLVAESDGEIIGYAGALNVTPEADITKVSTKTDRRRQGVGFALLCELLLKEAEAGIEKIYLEVRESNAPALRLYKKTGFKVTGLRKNYYTLPQENAVTMTYETAKTDGGAEGPFADALNQKDGTGEEHA